VVSAQVGRHRASALVNFEQENCARQFDGNGILDRARLNLEGLGDSVSADFY
jgi:hypothetical protein